MLLRIEDIFNLWSPVPIIGTNGIDLFSGPKGKFGSDVIVAREKSFLRPAGKAIEQPEIDQDKIYFKECAHLKPFNGLEE
jgi:hypothetical protein